MKKYLLTFVFAFVAAFSALAQSPSTFSYQAVARDASNNVLINKSIGLRMSVLSGATPLYTETFSTQTNAYGMFTINLGTGTSTLNTFSGIDWIAGNAKSLKVEIDVNGGTNYTDLGTTAFTSVPYAMVANTVNNVALNDLTNVNAPTPTTNQVLQWNGSEWAPATLSTSSPALVTSATLSGSGTAASPLTIAQQSASNGQVLQWNGSAWTPATVTGGVGDNWGTQFVQKNVTLDGNGTAALPLKIAQQGATTGESLLWNGSLWTPGRPAITTDGVFTGQGTPTLPLKLGQQGAAVGQVLKWNGTTWLPGSPFSLPYSGVGIGGAGFATFFITNPATTGPSLNAIDGVSSAGVGVHGVSDSPTGKGVWGRSDNGIGVYGSSTNGLAGNFDGTVAVFGQLKVYGSQVLKSDNIYVADQPNSVFNAPVNAINAIPGLSAVGFTVNNDNSVTASTPAKVLVTINCPNYVAPNANAAVRYSLTIKKELQLLLDMIFIQA